MLYLLFFLSAYLLYKEVKNKEARRKIILAYASVFFIAVLYNLGELVGTEVYYLGVQF